MVILEMVCGQPFAYIDVLCINMAVECWQFKSVKLVFLGVVYQHQIEYLLYVT